MSDVKKKIFLLYAEVLNIDRSLLLNLDDGLGLDELLNVSYSDYKELSNFYVFLSSLEDDDFSYLPIRSSNRKNCIYAVLDDAFERFCLDKSINLNDFSWFLKAVSMYSILENILFQRYEIFNKNEFFLESFLNGELTHIKRVVLCFKYLWPCFFSKLGLNEGNLLKFLKICIFLRYSFNNNKFKFEFDKKR